MKVVGIEAAGAIIEVLELVHAAAVEAVSGETEVDVEGEYDAIVDLIESVQTEMVMRWGFRIGDTRVQVTIDISKTES